MDGADHLRYGAGLALVAILAAVSGGCGGNGEGARTTTGEDGTETATAGADTAPTTTGARLEQECRNPETGYTVRYPADWFTNPGEVVPTCRFFHPEPFEVPEQTEAVGLAISIQVAPLRFEDLLEQVGTSPAQEVQARDRLTIDGQPAARIESVATGDALLPDGTPVTSYYVDLGGRTLVASTVGTGELDHERNREILRQMVESLELTQPQR